jgi:hypothetical protein
VADDREELVSQVERIVRDRQRLRPPFEEAPEFSHVGRLTGQLLSGQPLLIPDRPVGGIPTGAPKPVSVVASQTLALLVCIYRHGNPTEKPIANPSHQDREPSRIVARGRNGRVGAGNEAVLAGVSTCVSWHAQSCKLRRERLRARKADIGEAGRRHCHGNGLSLA